MINPGLKSATRKHTGLLGLLLLLLAFLWRDDRIVVGTGKAPAESCLPALGRQHKCGKDICFQTDGNWKHHKAVGKKKMRYQPGSIHFSIQCDLPRPLSCYYKVWKDHLPPSDPDPLFPWTHSLRGPPTTHC